MLDQVTLNEFLPHLDSTFLLESDATARVELRLVEAVSAASGGTTRPAHLSGRAPFSLVFLAPAGINLSQSIYRIHHDVLGDLEIFMVPIGLDRGRLKLEAVFN